MGDPVTPCEINMNVELASRLSQRLGAIHDELNNLLSEAKEHCKEDEFIFYSYIITS